MTVAEIDDDGMVYCVWFENADRRAHHFQIATLKKTSVEEQ